MGRFDSSTVIVTGAARGQGRGIARAFVEAGADVAICDLGTSDGGTDYALSGSQDLSAAAEELEGLGGRVVARSCDVRSTDEVEAFVAAVVEELGPTKSAGQQRRDSAWDDQSTRDQRCAVRERVGCESRRRLSDVPRRHPASHRRRRRSDRQHLIGGRLDCSPDVLRLLRVQACSRRADESDGRRTRRGSHHRQRGVPRSRVDHLHSEQTQRTLEWHWFSEPPGRVTSQCQQSSSDHWLG